MSQMGAYTCEICGAQKLNGHWFLATLEILRWDAKTAIQSDVSHACSAAHVEQLVSHWVAYGGLNYDNTRPQPTISPVLVQQGRQSDVVGKLTVDRPTLGRGLEAQPGMLATILDAIDVALQTTDFVEPPEAEREQDFEFDA